MSFAAAYSTRTSCCPNVCSGQRQACPQQRLLMLFIKDVHDMCFVSPGQICEVDYV